jgi:hypothetical protein
MQIPSPRWAEGLGDLLFHTLGTELEVSWESGGGVVLLVPISSICTPSKDSQEREQPLMACQGVQRGLAVPQR